MDDSEMVMSPVLAMREFPGHLLIKMLQGEVILFEA
jgi:hypothetical protein